jgi:hypothetical protein
MPVSDDVFNTSRHTHPAKINDHHQLMCYNSKIEAARAASLFNNHACYSYTLQFYIMGHVFSLFSLVLAGKFIIEYSTSFPTCHSSLSSNKQLRTEKFLYNTYTVRSISFRTVFLKTDLERFTGQPIN